MRLVLILAIVVVSAPALAQDRRPEDSACGCRAPSRTVEVGTRLCLPTASGPRFATCVLEQNVTSWRFSDEGCALSHWKAEPPPSG